MNLVIVINGSGGVGKDTFVSTCKEILKKYNIDVHNYSTISIVKHIMKRHMSWNHSKTEKDRKFMSDFKKLLKDYNDIPFNDVTYYINANIETSKNKVFFVHTREPEEIQEFVDYYNEYGIDIFTILITRPNYEILSNESDKNVNNFNYDYVINNDKTIEELNHQSKLFSKTIINKFIENEDVNNI